jgi:hypothetical protein
MNGGADNHATDALLRGDTVFIPIRSILVVVVVVIMGAISTASAIVPVRIAVASAGTSATVAAAVRHGEIV